MCSELYPPRFDLYMLYRLQQGYSREQATRQMQAHFQSRLQGNRPDVFQNFVYWNTVKAMELYSNERRWNSVLKDYEKGQA